MDAAQTDGREPVARGDMRIVTWHEAIDGASVLVALRDGGPLHRGTITLVGNSRCRIQVDDRQIWRRFGTFYYSAGRG
jgi:hypothetical protein